MRKNAAKLLVLTMLFLPLILHAQPDNFRFAVLMHILQANTEDTALEAAIDRAQFSSPAFILVNGIKRADEACTDKRYRQRKTILEGASVPVFLSMAGSDWVTCRDTRGRISGIERLATLREQLYGNISWSGARQINMTRQSSSKAYRSYSENTRWEYGDILFATINLPAPNNRYVPDAGRNSEFEDRQIANRNWLRRVFSVAKRDRLSAIVIFCDGKVLPDQSLRSATQRDGFAEVRQQLRMLAPKFKGRVLVIQSAAAQIQNRPATSLSPEFIWHGNLGYLSLAAGHTTIDVNPTLPRLFEIEIE